MIKLPADITPPDVHQWLNGGHMYVDTASGRRVCSYLGHSEEDSSYIEVYDISDERMRPMRVPTDTVSVHWPYCGALNYEGFAVFLNRRQVRQYRRTYNSRQLEVNIPRKWEAMKMYGNVVRALNPDTPVLVREAFAPTYTPFGTAVQLLSSRQAFSRAINPHVIVVGAEDNVLVYYKGVYVAVINPTGRMIPVNADENTLRRLLKYFDGRVTL